MENQPQYIIFIVAAGVGLVVYLWEFLWRRKREQEHLQTQRKKVEALKDINFLGGSESKPKLVNTLFTCFYGVKIQLDPDNEEALEACEIGIDQRCKEAKDRGLEIYCDRLTDGVDYFLYIGKSLGSLSLDSHGHVSIKVEILNEVIKNTNAKLSQFEISESPSLHLQASHEY